jgi:quinol monooxygenase YgiN
MDRPGAVPVASASGHPYVRVEDVPASWDRYAAIARSVGQAPRGLLLHVAGPTDEGFRIVEVWRDEADWQRFATDFDAAVAAIDPDVELRPAIRDLHAVHIAGEAWRSPLIDVSTSMDEDTGR